MPATALQPSRASADRRRPRVKFATLGLLALTATALLPAGISGAATTVELGTAESFGVLGASTVTNTGPTTIWGDLGVQSDAPDALTGMEDATIGGDIHAGTGSDAPNAQADALVAYGALAAQPCEAEGGDLTGLDLGERTLEPGVYCFDSSAQLTGALTLDALADPAAVFIFRTASTLTTATASSVQFANDFASCNVFWQVGSSATLGTETDFVGTVLAHTSITATTDATVEGRLIALNGAVTLDSNVITQPYCPAAAVTPIVVPPADVPPAEDEPDAEPDDTPVDDTPPDDRPVAEDPLGDDVDGSPDADSPSDATPLDDSGAEATAGGPALPGPTTGGPADAGGPGLTTDGPSTPRLTGGPVSPGPTLPRTGSTMTLGAFGALAVLVGAGLVLLTGPKRVHAARTSSSDPTAPIG